MRERRTYTEEDENKVRFLFLNSPDNTVPDIIRHTGFKPGFVHRIIDSMCELPTDLKDRTGFER